MPSRWLTVTIVLFWLATTSWLFWRDLWPAWRPGEPPPFHIDLVEEVQPGNMMKTSWTVARDQGEGAKNVFAAWTEAKYHPTDDTFTLRAEFKPALIGKGSPVSVGEEVGKGKTNGYQVIIKEMESEYRVNRQGHLQSLHAAIKGKLHLKGEEMDAEASLGGEVRDEQFFAHYRLSTPGNTLLEGDFNPAPLSYHGSIVMPLHPVNRIHGLKPGQSWRQALVDPFRDVFPALGGGVHYLHARVLDQPKILGEGKDATTCLVIEYTGEDMSAKTWVELDSERVQRQEFTLGKDTWIIQRDPSKHSL